MKTDGAPIPVWIEFESVADDFTGDLPALSVSRIDGVRRKHDLRGTNPDDDGFRSGRWQRVRAGDLLVNRMQAWRGAAGVAWEDGITSSHYLVFRPRGTRFDLRFLDYLVRSPPIVALFDSRSIGIRNDQYELSRSRFAELRISAPALEEQRRIADMLDTETARIDVLVKKNEVATELAQLKLRETMAVAVTHGISGTATKSVNAPWARTIAAEWDWVPYQYFADLGTGHTPSRSDSTLWQDCTIPWVTTADVKHLRDFSTDYLTDTEYHLSERGLANSAARLLPERTVVLSRTASVGFSAIVTMESATSQDFFTWTCDKQRLLPEYLLYVLRAMKFRGHFDRLMYGSTHKTIYFPDLVQLRGPLPPLTEQQAIVDHVRQRSQRLRELRARMARMNALLRDRRQALITAAVTGTIRT